MPPKMLVFQTIRIYEIKRSHEKITSDACSGSEGKVEKIEKLSNNLKDIII